jgi:hypothetical protein
LKNLRVKWYFGGTLPLESRAVLGRTVGRNIVLMLGIVLLTLVGDTAASCRNDCVTATLVVGYRTLIAYLIFLVVQQVAARFEGVLHLSLMAIVIILSTTALFELALRPLGYSQFDDPWRTVQSLMITYVLTEVAIAIWWYHILDPNWRASDPEDEDGPDGVHDAVRLGDDLLAMADIDEVRTEGRFVVFVVRGEARVLPMRFSDALSALRPGYGIQVSRSLWLADRLFAACEPRGKALMLVLADGREIPIGVTRRERVLAWASALSLRRGVLDQG